MVFRDGSGPAMARSARRSAYLTGQTISNAAWRWSPASSGVGYSDASYTANRLDQYASVTGAVMNYDLNGNLVCISGPVACAARGDDFIYSAENQLLRAYGPDADYSYGPAARRVRKDVAGVVTDFLHAGAMEIAEYGASGTLLRRYIPGPGVDQRIAMIECGAGGGAAACAPGGAGVATRYYFADRQGNVLALANQDGTLAQQFFYTPFGVELVGNAGENPFRYTGRRFDPETGLYYYRARYYDADLGRFLQVDPVGYADQWNLYAYVGNNPLNATDPTGMFGDGSGGTSGCSLLGCQQTDSGTWQDAAVGFIESAATTLAEPLGLHPDITVTQPTSNTAMGQAGIEAGQTAGRLVDAIAGTKGSRTVLRGAARYWDEQVRVAIGVRRNYHRLIGEVPGRARAMDGSLEDQARWAFGQRNEIRSWARRQVHWILNLQHRWRRVTFDDLVQRRTNEGMTRDEALNDIIDGSSRSRKSVDEAAGITRHE